MAATELGDVEVVDLEVLSRDYCELMDEVSKDWEGGRSVVQEPPAGHPCGR